MSGESLLSLMPRNWKPREIYLGHASVRCDWWEINGTSNRPLERTRHNCASIRSSLGEPLKRSVQRNLLESAVSNVCANHA